MKNIANILLAFSPLAGGGSLMAQVNKPGAARPNIIYIMCDDHAYQAISAYNGPLAQLAPTPNIDRIANEGIVFRNAFVENSLSTPSRACLMTGLYSHQSGQRQLNEGIDTTKVFFTERLQEVGYQTGIVGKWHILCEPKGFDDYHILNDQGTYYNPVFKSKGNDSFKKETGYVTSLITEHAIGFLDKRDKDKPFCLMIHHKAPHRNWMPELKYLDLYDDVEFPLPETFRDDYSGKCDAAKQQKMTISKDIELIQDLKVDEWRTVDTTKNGKRSYVSLLAEAKRMTKDQKAVWDAHYSVRNQKFMAAPPEGDDLTLWKYQNYLKDYLRCVKSVDDAVGDVLDYLEKNNLKENTIIIYTSDQGFYLGEHHFFDKRFMYEEAFKTPLLMSYPKAIKAGSESDALVQNIDFAPTLLALAGAEKTEEMTGTSLEPLFNGEKPADWRTSVYYHYYDYPSSHLVRKHDGVRTERYKLIHFYGKGGMRGATTKYQTTEGYIENTSLRLLQASDYITDQSDIDCYELYDLKTDPNEMHNLYEKPGYETLTQEMRALLLETRESLQVPDGEFAN